MRRLLGAHSIRGGGEVRKSMKGTKKIQVREDPQTAGSSGDKLPLRFPLCTLLMQLAA